MTPMLEAIALRRQARETGQTLLDAPRFHISPGDRVGIRGPSGSGKTLLLRALAWLDQLDEGYLVYRGQRVSHDLVPGYRRRVMYLHQKPVLDGLTVEETLGSPFRLRVHRNRRYKRETAAAFLDELGRGPDFLAKRVRELSGGESQIAALVRALLLEPEILLFDEATAALDPQTTDRFEELASRWVAGGNEGRALLWVSHDATQTGRMTSRTVSVDAGRVTEPEN